MSLASRKAFNARLLTTLTLILVVVNMVPIVWMVYCSFKDNEEILAGVVAPGRRHYDVNFLESIPGGFLAGTQDGGIARLDEKLQIVKHVNLGTFATCFLVRGDTLWVMSSNRGLRAFSVQTLEKLAEYSVKDMAAALAPAWKTLWVNDVSGSYLTQLGRHLYFGYVAKDFSGIISLNLDTKQFSWVPKINKETVGQIREMTEIGDTALSMLTSKGYYRLRPNDGQILKVLPSPSVLVGDANHMLELGHNQTLFARGKSALVYDLTGDSVLCSLDEDAGLGTSVLSAYALQGGHAAESQQDRVLWLGNSQFVSAVRLNDTSFVWTAGEQRKIQFQTDADTDADDVTGSEATRLLTLPSGVQVIGGTKGGLVQLDAKGETVARAALPKSPYYFRWRNFVDLWRNIDFGLYLTNSFVICGSVMLIAMVLASLGGYALARYEFPGKNTFGYSVLATQMIPGIMLLLPIYLMYVNIAKSTGLVVKGTYMGLILTYAAYFVPFSIWILRGFFASIPKELEEAALIDGCGPFRAFFQIIVPSAMPGIIATGVYVFLSAWDELMFAWVLTSEQTYTIPVGIRLFVGNFQNRYDLMMAAATVSTLPVMLLFFLMQRHIVAGLTAGAVKD
jgi:multiple sugar transport system permease protein